MLNLTRREALKAASAGFGYLAFSGLATHHAEEKKSLLAPVPRTGRRRRSG